MDRQNLPLSWIPKDAWLIIWARAFRTLASSMLGVVFAVYLTLIGLSLLQIGLLLTMGMVGGAVFATVVVFFGDTLSRRVLLVGFTLLTAGAAALLGVTDHVLVLAAGGFLGSLAAGAGPHGGPVQPLEQASLPSTVSAQRRTDVFAIYGMVGVGTAALGSLAAGSPQLLQAWGVDEVQSFRFVFFAAAGFILLGALLYAMISPSIEVPVDPSRARRWNNPMKLQARGIIFRVVGIFSIDQFGTTIIPRTLVALWFHEKFDMDIGAVASVFFGAEIMSMISQWVAGKIANKYGLLNTIVLTQVPPTVIITIMPFVPFAWMAVALWLLRGLFSVMDSPTKHSYTMAIVPADERSSMAGLNNLARSGVGSVSPSASTALWTAFWSGMPFVISGAFKSIYLVVFYINFRNVHTEEELERKRQSAAAKEAETAAIREGS